MTLSKIPTEIAQSFSAIFGENIEKILTLTHIGPVQA
jgi:hypothetical protein